VRSEAPFSQASASVEAQPGSIAPSHAQMPVDHMLLETMELERIQMAGQC
jgi:hypothetical protein